MFVEYLQCGKECMLLRSQRKSSLSKVYLVASFIFVVILAMSTQGMCLDKDGQCSAAREKWEKLHQELKDKLNGFVSIQQQPVEKIIQRPLLTTTSGKTIARQIAEALQVKEDLLAEKRLDCRKLMEAEKQAFDEVEQCMGPLRNSKNKELAALEKSRKALLEKAVTTLAEVKEVEGRETILPYAEATGDRYRQSVNNYWQSYEQNYRRWWGY